MADSKPKPPPPVTKRVRKDVRASNRANEQYIQSRQEGDELEPGVTVVNWPPKENKAMAEDTKKKKPVEKEEIPEEEESYEDEESESSEEQEVEEEEGSEEHGEYVEVDEEGDPEGDPDFDPEQQGEEGDMQDIPYEGGEEPLGAQILRIMYEDLASCLENYYTMLSPLDNPQVYKFVEKKLSVIDKEMTDMEMFFDKTYGPRGLPPLGSVLDPGMQEDGEGLPPEEQYAEDMGDGEIPPDADQLPPEEEMLDEEMPMEGEEEAEIPEDISTDAVPAGSGVEEEPSPEEVVEGMREGDRRRRNGKSLATAQGKAICPGCGKAKCGCSIPAGKKDMVREQHVHKPIAQREAERVALRGNDPGEVEAQHRRNREGARRFQERVMPSDRMPNPPQAEKPVVDPNQSTTQDFRRAGGVNLDSKDLPPHAKGLEEYEKGFLREATDFLDDLSRAMDFGDEGKLKSHHYHKLLEKIAFPHSPIAKLEGEEKTGVDPGSDPRRRNTMGVKQMDSSMGMSGGMGMPSFQDHHPHRMAAGLASRFLGLLAKEKTYGEPHRIQAKLHHTALNAICQELEAANIQAPGETTPEEPQLDYEPGEMQTKEGLEGDVELEDKVPRAKAPEIREQLRNKKPGKKKPGDEEDSDDEETEEKPTKKEDTKSLKEVMLRQSKAMEELSARFASLMTQT